MPQGPPGTDRAAGARWLHDQREGSAGQPCLDAEGLVRLARQSPAVAALNIGHSRLSRIVRAYIAEGAQEQDVVRWITSYADPTATSAIRNVLREGKGRAA